MKIDYAKLIPWRTARKEPATKVCEFVTEQGCVVSVSPSPEHLGDGVAVALWAPDAGRGWTIWLNKDQMATLAATLQA